MICLFIMSLVFDYVHIAGKGGQNPTFIAQMVTISKFLLSSFNDPGHFYAASGPKSDAYLMFS